MITIVVPFKNTGVAIMQCLNSLLEQTYRDFEVICVNDGSDIQTESLVKNVCRNDCRFVCIHNQGTGVSDARKTGILAMRGDYLCFVDSDDYVDPLFLESLLEPFKANSSLDVSVCSFAITVGGKVVSETQTKKRCNRIDSHYIFYHDQISFFLWNKMFRKGVISPSHFLSEIKVCEDVYILVNAFANGLNVCTLPRKPLYFYENNGMTTKYEKIFDGHSFLYEESFAIMKTLIHDERLSNDLDSKLCKIVVSTLRNFEDLNSTSKIALLNIYNRTRRSFYLNKNVRVIEKCRMYLFMKKAERGIDGL